MTEKTFEEQFPSLKGKEIWVNQEGRKKERNAPYGIDIFYEQQDIQKYCLDKQKTKEIIDSHIDPLRFQKETREFIARIKEELLWELDGKCPCIFHKPKFVPNEEVLGL